MRPLVAALQAQLPGPGPVEIGVETYICPVKSVSVMTSRSVITLREWDEGFTTITFDSYHLFRAQSKMLEGISSSPGHPFDEKGTAP